VVGETGTANLPEPGGVPFRSGGRASTEHEIALPRCKPMPQLRRGREPITDRNATITTSRQKLNDAIHAVADAVESF
jgi:hypothetical protein